MLQVSNDRATWYEIELDGDVVIPFVFAVDDIRENVKRASYSKTFTVKGTPRNVQLLAALYQTHAYDVESWSRVVCNRPLYARLYGDAVLVYEGMLMITQARYTQGAVEFDCSLFDTQMERLSVLLSKPLSSLRMRKPSFSALKMLSEDDGADMGLNAFAVVPIDKGQVRAEDETNADVPNNVRDVRGFRTCYLYKTPVWCSVRAILSVLLGESGLEFDEDSRGFWGVDRADWLVQTTESFFIERLVPSADIAVRQLFVTSCKVPMTVGDEAMFSVTYRNWRVSRHDFFGLYKEIVYIAKSSNILSGGSNASWTNLPGSTVSYTTARDKISLNGKYNLFVRITLPKAEGHLDGYVVVNNNYRTLQSDDTNWYAEIYLKEVENVQFTVALHVRNTVRTYPECTVTIGVPEQVAKALTDRVSLSSILPDMTVGDFLTMLMQLFNMVSYIYGGKWRFLPATLFWKSETVIFSDRLDYSKEITISFPIQSQPRYYERKYTDIEGAYFYDKHRVEQRKTLGYMRYDSKVFYNKDADEYECPLSLPFPTKHPLYGQGSGLSNVPVPVLSRDQWSSYEPPLGMIGYIRKKTLEDEPLETHTMSYKQDGSYHNFYSRWLCDYQMELDGEGTSLLFDTCRVAYVKPTRTRKIIVPTLWQRFHEPIVNMLTSADSKLVSCSLYFNPYEISSSSELLWRLIQIDGVVYRFHRIGDIDILRGGVYACELLRVQPISAIPSGSTVVEGPYEKNTTTATHPSYEVPIAYNENVVNSGVAKVEYTPGYSGGVVRFERNFGGGSLVALHNNSGAALNVDTQGVEGAVVIGDGEKALFVVLADGQAVRLWQG